MSKRHAHHGEGSVFKLADPARQKPWVAQITLESGKKKMSYHATYQQAMAARREMVQEQKGKPTKKKVVVIEIKGEMLELTETLAAKCDMTIEDFVWNLIRLEASLNE